MNITFQHHDVLSPYLACVIEIRESNDFICHVHRTWVEKGEGKVVITFKNDMDFRTIAQFDSEYIFKELLEEDPYIVNISEMCITDGAKDLQLGPSPRNYEGWMICNNALSIIGVLFDLSMTRIVFDILE